MSDEGLAKRQHVISLYEAARADSDESSMSPGWDLSLAAKALHAVVTADAPGGAIPLILTEATIHPIAGGFDHTCLEINERTSVVHFRCGSVEVLLGNISQVHYDDETIRFEASGPSTKSVFSVSRNGNFTLNTAVTDDAS